MVRLMLVAAPAFVLLGALGLSGLMSAYAKDARVVAPTEEEDPKQVWSGILCTRCFNPKHIAGGDGLKDRGIRAVE